MLYPKSYRDLSDRLFEVEQALQYGFRSKLLLLQALTHRSYLNEASDASQGEPVGCNERLEFLGDAILDTLISRFLFEQFPTLSEGQLSQLRAQLVDAKQCASHLNQLGVGHYLLMGRGQRMSACQHSLHADLFEALLGAIYLDGGWPAAERFFWGHFRDSVLELCHHPQRNWKAELQDCSQKRWQLTPTYQVLCEQGPEHTKAFEVGVFVADRLLAKGVGNSKKSAQQDAARRALESGFQLGESLES